MMNKAKILEVNKDNINICVERLKNNKLVAIPTETVYGLAGNALDKIAFNKIFEMKKRPKTDPLIVHVQNFEDALLYFNINETEKLIAKLLTDNFWPGPLTILIRKNKLISDELTNNSEFVGMRCPNHPITLELIKLSKLPLAAPSANIFCHVSPTESKHVYNDFKNEDLVILEGGNCQIGMESTIVKIDNKNISFLRWGGINKIQIEKVLKELPFKLNSFESDIKNIKDKKDSENNIAPGQFLKHYAPYCDCKLFTNLEKIFIDNNYDNKKEVIIIDFAAENIKFADKFLEYYDLSAKGDLKEAMKNFYSKLREAEQKEGVKLIIISYLLEKDDLIKENLNFKETIIDKQLRSTSKNFI